MKQCPPDYQIHRYADSVIADHPELYDGIEVQGVRSYQTGADSWSYEVDNENPEAYSVYVHMVEGGVHCVGDFTRRSDAQAYGHELGETFGWTVYDFSKEMQPEAA